MPKELAALLKQLRADYPQALDGAIEAAPIDQAEPLLGHFLRSFLIWESTLAKAALAMKRIEQSVVDFNELRVCMPGEMVRVLGERYPRAEERARRLRTALNAIYSREHKVSLERLSEMSKRESREYLETLDGTPRFVAARVSLLGLAGHMAPVDGRMVRRLIERGVVEADSTPEAAAASLERKVRAAEMPECYALLQAWSDEGTHEHAEAPRSPAPGAAAKAEGRKPPAKPAAAPKPKGKSTDAKK
jgi:hypothetical protein